jgi:hypothetical protein
MQLERVALQKITTTSFQFTFLWSKLNMVYKDGEQLEYGLLTDITCPDMKVQILLNVSKIE